MIDSDRDLDMTLKLTRMLAEPSMADGARVLSAVRSELAALPAASTPGAAAAGASRAASRVRPLAAAAKPKLQSAALHQLLAVAGVAAALGFAAGWVLRDNTPDSELAPREMVALPPPAPAAATEERPQPPEREPAPAPAAVSEPSATLEEAASSAEATPSAETAATEPAAKPKSRARKPARKPAAPAAPAPDSSEFFEAVNLLRRAQRAVNRGDGQVALSLLAELDTRFDRKTLGEEREATRALALCANGDVEGATRAARELARGTPSSIYAGRLRLSCTGWFKANGEPEPRANAPAQAVPGTEPPSP